jgi:nucleotide-binding universal stress UspA family protein
MGRYKKLLVAVDGSQSSMHALSESFRLASNEKSWITVVSVVPRYAGDLSFVAIGNVADSLRKPCEAALSIAQKLADDACALIKTVCEEGEIFERVVDLAEAENCDLIIMGRRGMSRIERTLVGSVTARVIGHSQRDVLVVPSNSSVGWKKILVATDGSKYSKLAVERAIDFAKSYEGELRVVSVVDVPAEFYAEAADAVENMIDKSKGFLEDIKDQAESEGINTKTFAGEGEAYQVITDLATEQNADVIVMGSHGRTGLKRLLMGSVAEKVIGHASCPVLVVKS